MLDRKKSVRQVYSVQWQILVILLITLGFAQGAFAASIAGEMRQAGRLYEEGKYDEALAGYDKAISESPDEAVAHYNRAVTLYRKAEFNDARKAFVNSLAYGEEDLEGRAVYNMGNSAFRSAEGAVKVNPESSLKNYTEALQYYRQAIELSSEDDDAKYNYEYTLKKINDLKNEMQQQNQDQKQDQEKEEKEQDKEDQKDKDKQQDKQNREQGGGSNKEEDKKDKGQEKKEKEQDKDQEKDSNKAEQDKEQQEEEQDQRESDRQQGEGGQPQPRLSDEWEGGVPEQMEEPGYDQGEMTKEEAEMLLRGQQEEENRMRDEQKKKRVRSRPSVLRDW